ncbi:hypothetical protein [Actinoplanes sp. GCM10030250]|uniref:hypothetical protein n=1 Tax=Actinoplanes sp. GCM10030250 TaxID=3273376 RepID=UPI003607664E
MPERDPQAGHNARLLRGLLWAGVVIAPLAAAVVLVGGGSSSVRFGVVLVAVSVVLVGASTLIRNDPVLLRMDVEDRVAEEVEALRKEMRAELAAVASVAQAPPPRPLTPRTSGGRAQVAAVPPMDAGYAGQDFGPSDVPAQPLAPVFAVPDDGAGYGTAGEPGYGDAPEGGEFGYGADGHPGFGPGSGFADQQDFPGPGFDSQGFDSQGFGAPKFEGPAYGGQGFGGQGYDGEPGYDVAAGYSQDTTGYDDDYGQEGFEPGSFESGSLEPGGFEQGGDYGSGEYGTRVSNHPGGSGHPGTQFHESPEPPAARPTNPGRSTGGRASVPGGRVPQGVPHASGAASVPAPGPMTGSAQVSGVPGARPASMPVAPSSDSGPVPRPRAAASVPPSAPGQVRPSGAASVPPPGAAPARAAASVRPGPPSGAARPGPPTGAARPGPPSGAARPAPPPGPPRSGPHSGPAGPGPHGGPQPVRPGTQYGRPDSPDGDFGAANGYAGANDYGFEEYDQRTGQAESGYYEQGAHETGGYEAGTYEAEGYEPGGYPAEVFESGGFSANEYDSGAYQKADQPGDGAEYKARRHRPSANDTNVGSLADFATYGGYRDDPR